MGLADAAGASVAGRLGGGLLVRGATEGAIAGGAERAFSLLGTDDPVTLDIIASEIGSGVFWGGAIGTGAGGLGLAIGGLTKQARKATEGILDRAAAKASGNDGSLRSILDDFDKSRPTAATRRGYAKALSEEQASNRAAYQEEVARLKAASESAGELAAVKADPEAYELAFSRWKQDAVTAEKYLNKYDGFAKKMAVDRPELKAQADAYLEARKGMEPYRPVRKGKMEDIGNENPRADMTDARKAIGKKRGKTEYTLEPDERLRQIVDDPVALGAIKNAQDKAIDLLQAYKGGEAVVDDFAKLMQGDLRSIKAKMEQLAKPVNSEKLAQLDVEFAARAEQISKLRATDNVSDAKALVDLAEGKGLKASRDEINAFAKAEGLPDPAPGSSLETLVKERLYRKTIGAAKGAPDASEGLAGKVAGFLGNRAGAMLGGAVGHAIGGPAGMLAGAWAGDMVRGMATSKNMAKLLASKDTFIRRVADGVEKLGKGTAKASTKSAAAAVGQNPYGDSKAKDTSLASFKKRHEELTKLAASPEGARSRIYEQLAGVRAANPQLADALQERLERKLQFLIESLPKRPSVASPYAKDNWRPPDAEIAKWARKAVMAEDPVRAIELMSEGKLTKEDVDTLEAVWPAAYREMQSLVTKNLAELQATLPYKSRIQLSLMMKVPVDPSMEPQNVRARQAVFAQEEAKPQASPNMSKLGSPEPTPTQALQNRP